eukprot:TRINITY_DN26697_c0_g1_i2.p1 TRINITY_DN26697_c0_g1~~TRINITY_DN26697_c0_g1_i2.p1  ORF type:complete len:183 (-),score=23.16 TRINITY_DN26697_c0_g1_i2:177-725(-)
MFGKNNECSVRNGCGAAYRNSVYRIRQAMTTSTTTAAMQAPTFLGCFLDDPHVRAFGDMEMALPEDASTVSACMAHCKGQGRKYMAISYGMECWCSDGTPDLSRYPKVDDSECSGRNNECWVRNGCGAAYRNSVYRIRQAMTTSTTTAAMQAPTFLGCFLDDPHVRAFGDMEMAVQHSWDAS